MTTKEYQATAAARLEENVKDRIVTDLATHAVYVRHENGLYRHYRCQRPNTICMYFDIVTWPGSLCYTGDMGDYLFQRTEDMIVFMRGSCMSYSYAAEKCVAHDGRLKEFSEQQFFEQLEERRREACDGLDARYHSDAIGAINDKIEAIRRRYDCYNNPHDAITAMYESGLWDGCDLPSCDLFTFHFLWCLHAIKWFCEQLDAGKVITQTEPTP